MYTPEDIEKIVLDFVSLGMAGFIAGNITRKDERVSGSNEDITIGTLSLTDGDVQRGIVNVSIYIKDLNERNEAQQKIDTKPDTARFDIITRKIFAVLGGNYGIYWSRGNLWITNPTPLYAQVEAKEHFRAIRVQLKLHEYNFDQFYDIFYGPMAGYPTTEEEVLALESSSDTTDYIVLNTGSDLTHFVIVMPINKSILNVIDLDAQNLDITSEYVDHGEIVVNELPYKVWSMTTAIPYQQNHKHQIKYIHQLTEF